MDFVTLSNSPAYYLPSGAGSYFGSGNDMFLNITATVPTSADPSSMSIYTTLLQMGNDGSLSPITLSGGNPAFNVSSFTIGTPSSCTFSTSALQLTPDLVRELLNGQLFVESDFTYGEYLGQISPVPEPSCLTLICSVIGLYCSVQFICRAKNPPPNGASAPVKSKL
jgi:hypothetical protein